MATFAMNGAEKCSGLSVERYSVERLCQFAGDQYQLIGNFEYSYQNPSGDVRPYVYVCFQKMKAQ